MPRGADSRPAECREGQLAIRFSLTLLVAALLAAGCASARRGIGDNVTIPKIIDIIPGKTTRVEVGRMFGKPDLVKDLGRGKTEYTYLQGKSDSVSWLILSGYLLYHPTTAFSGDRILIVRFEDDKVERFVASDGKLTLKKGYEKEPQDKSSGTRK